MLCVHPYQGPAGQSRHVQNRKGPAQSDAQDTPHPTSVSKQIGTEAAQVMAYYIICVLNNSGKMHFFETHVICRFDSQRD